jgi:hypothetical protein
MAVTCMSSETSSGTKGANAAPSGSCGQKGKGRSESKSTSRSYARLLLLLLVGHWLLAASCDREGDDVEGVGVGVVRAMLVVAPSRFFSAAWSAPPV